MQWWPTISALAVITLLSVNTAVGDSLDSFSKNSLAQQTKQTSVSVETPRPNEGTIAEPIYRSLELWLAVLVIFLGIVVLTVEAILLKSANSSPADILRTLVLTIIIIGALFTIPAGFGPQQIAPTIGLFGTIAGYLLGKSNRSA